MTIEIGLVFALVGCLLAVLGFLGGQKKAASSDGERWGKFTAKLDTELEYIKRDLGDIKQSVGENTHEMKDSIRRMHKRLDEHLKQDHKLTVVETES